MPEPAPVLIVGGGGREHAIAESLRRSPEAGAIYITRRNAACARFALPAPAANYSETAAFCREKKIQLAVVGPEAPLAEGAADILRAEGIAVFGPSQKAAKIESSKIHAKQLMEETGIKTPRYSRCENAEDVARWCAKNNPPFVVKADGLAAGKGVFVCEKKEGAQKAAAKIFSGEFGARLLLMEEYCGGEEASFIAIAEGESAQPLPSSRDYKRLREGGEGPNTGGMGAISPSPSWNDALSETAMNKIIRPALSALAKAGSPFCGFLYAGIVINNGELSVLEFNCRLGDPEAQAILPRLNGDIFPALFCAARGELNKCELPKAQKPSACVVLASEGYPESPVAGDEITFSKPWTEKGEPSGDDNDIFCFHAGTKLRDDGKTVTDGGRVMSVVALAEKAEAAREKAYRAAEGVSFRGMQFRRDIGE